MEISSGAWLADEFEYSQPPKLVPVGEVIDDRGGELTSESDSKLIFDAGITLGALWFDLNTGLRHCGQILLVFTN